METAAQRRKACDLCFIKKIKCNMLRPACGNCVLYGIECRTSTVRRRAPPSKPRPQKPAAQASTDSARVTELEGRLARMEQQLQEALEANGRNLSKTQSRSSTTSSSVETSAEFEYATDSVSRRSATLSEVGTDSGKQRLPPLEEIKPIIDIFFERYNSFMPLFDQRTFMRMLSDWYSPSSPQCTAVWAAVNMTMALGYRCTLMQSGDVNALVDDQKVQYHMRNVQSVVSELVTREEDLLGLQVILGMVVLFQGTKDPKPATVLIGTAVRLAHRMHLHDRESLQFFPEEIARQRSRLFWMTYVMDKELCLRFKMPSFQLDVDIDLPLPALNPEDGAGVVCARDGSKLNFFRARVELSHISGKVYDQLYSTRARKVSAQERQARVARLDGVLETWRRDVPFEFQLGAALQYVEAIPAVHMSLLYHQYFIAVVMTHGIYSHDTEWVRRISRGDDGGGGSSHNEGRSPHASALPAGWGKCVELSRGCMKLFVESPKTDCSIWANSCMHFSGLIILLANMFVCPEHPHLTTDRVLVNQGLHLLEVIALVNGQESFRRLYDTVKELHRLAAETVDKAVRRRREAEVAAAGESILTFGTQFEDDVDFLPGAHLGGVMLEMPVVSELESWVP